MNSNSLQVSRHFLCYFIRNAQTEVEPFWQYWHSNFRSKKLVPNLIPKLVPKNAFELPPWGWVTFNSIFTCGGMALNWYRVTTLIWEIHVLYYGQRRGRGLVFLASKFPFVCVSTYTNGNLDDNRTKPRTWRCRSYCMALSVCHLKESLLLPVT